MQHSPGFLKLVEKAKEKIQEITVGQVMARLNRRENFYLVDVREDDEWKAGHAKGAIHLGKGVIERDIEKAIPDKNADIVLYCGGGFRSALAAESLVRMGYKKALSLEGGWRAWVGEGLPTE